MTDRTRRQPQVTAFLERAFRARGWQLALPAGTGHETYVAAAGEARLFVKLGAANDRYQAAAALGLAPPVLAAGALEDGTPILVQPFVEGREPTRADFRARLVQFAAALRALHASPELRAALPPAPSESYREAGLAALSRVRARWEAVRPLVSNSAALVDESLARLEGEMASLEGSAFEGSGLAASHNDPCNANWRVTPAGRVYLLDFDLMSPDDPALDLGALLWWYYPPDLRPRFLSAAGRADTPALRRRMRVRMALHALSILLPRPGSFDRFDPPAFAANLVDFRALMAGEENPQGYG